MLMAATFGVSLAQPGRGTKSNVTAYADAAEARARKSAPTPPANDGVEPYPEPVVEGKWPAWKVTTMVLLFCGAFWACVYYAGKAIFSLLG